jgi:phosphoenolpyruvate carboxykinase (ATP)
LLNAALSGALLDVEYYTDPVFGFRVPKTCPEVPEDVLYPSRAWQNQDEYWRKYRALAVRFKDNFKKFENDVLEEVRSAGPKIETN